jgi:tetratricopeptide (TPR) repeat protein
LRINPDFAEAHFNLGSALLQTGGRNEEAKRHFDEAVRLRPDLEPMVARLRFD